VIPWWITVRPTHPAPPGHLVPPASASRPLIEGTLTLLLDPTDVPLATCLPQTSSRPFVAQSAAYHTPVGECDDEDPTDAERREAMAGIYISSEGTDGGHCEGGTPTEEFMECTAQREGAPDGVRMCGIASLDRMWGTPSDYLRAAAQIGGFFHEGFDAALCADAAVNGGELAWTCGAMIPIVGTPGKWARNTRKAMSASDAGGDAARASDEVARAAARAGSDGNTRVWYNRHHQLTDGRHTIDADGMAPHKTGSFADGKSQWFSGVDAERATLDAARFADENGLWVGASAKVPVTNGVVGATARNGEPTTWINVYRNDNGFVHGSPGNPP
ncbi:MAG TPA: hypothetical protein VF228_04450, partial [Iamia sp.]